MLEECEALLVVVCVCVVVVCVVIEWLDVVWVGEEWVVVDVTDGELAVV